MKFNRNTGCFCFYMALVLMVTFITGLTVAEDINKTDKFPVLKGKYLGQPEPGLKPEIFAKGIISRGPGERDTAFTPDGKEIYYSIFMDSRRAVILYTKEMNGHWTEPTIAPFSGVYSDVEPFISPDGKRLYYASNRPFDGNGEPKDYDIWYVERKGDGWSEPINPGEPVNTPKNEFYPSLTKDGTLYVTAAYEGCLGGEDIFRFRLIDGKYTKPENIGDAVNSKYGEFNALIAPDESWLIYGTFRPGEGFGGGDLYISFRNDDGSWMKAVNMGEGINSAGIDYCPALSPDGKYLFFSSSRIASSIQNKVLKTRSDVEYLDNIAENGNDDIYWISSEIIDKLKTRK